MRLSGWVRQQRDSALAYNLWYRGKDKHRNGVGIIISNNLHKDVVDARPKDDRILVIKLVIGEEIINVLNVFFLESNKCS